MAADLNMEGVNKYASSSEQVSSITQFSDLQPTDWAFQALLNLIERYGCVAGYANGSFQGGQSISRYEAAALLNACLDRVTEVTDQLKKLGPVQRARRPPQQSTPDRLTLRGQGIGGGVS
jgi:hypothetical protein